MVDTRTRLIQIINDIASGDYSNDIMELTTEDTPEEFRDIAEAVGMMMVKIEAREYHLEQLTEELKNNSIQTVTAIATALGARDEYTEGHGDRVAAYSVRTGQRLNLPEREVEKLRIAGLLHDIGKIGFSDTLFSHVDSKPTEKMMEEIKNHPEWGCNILNGLDFLDEVRDYIYAHHERLDGSGYPRGLKEKDIPYGAKILAVADSFDAMTTDRPYQKGMAVEKSFSILRNLSGAALDGKIVETFIQDVRELGVIK